MHKRILVVQTAFIGDAILTLPLIQKLKEIYAESIIDVVCNPSAVQIFSSSPSVNEVLVLDKRGKHKSLFSLIKFSNNIKKNNYSLLFSVHRSLRTSLMVLFTDIKETYGFDNSSLMHVYKYLIPYNYNAHEVQRNLDLIGFKYDSESWKIKPDLVPGASEVNKVKSLIKERNIGKNLIAVAPGSIWNTKIYPLNYYSRIISVLKERKYEIILIGGEKDKAICEELATSNNAVNTAGLLSVVESIELLKYVKLLISNDSAPTHMGMCSDIPVLTLYCSTSFKFGFYPYNDKSSYLSYDDLFCKPCGIHGYTECPLGTFACGYSLKPEFVISKIENILND